MAIPPSSALLVDKLEAVDSLLDHSHDPATLKDALAGYRKVYAKLKKSEDPLVASLCRPDHRAVRVTLRQEEEEQKARQADFDILEDAAKRLGACHSKALEPKVKRLIWDAYNPLRNRRNVAEIGLAKGATKVERLKARSEACGCCDRANNPF